MFGAKQDKERKVRSRVDRVLGVIVLNASLTGRTLLETLAWSALLDKNTSVYASDKACRLFC